MITYYNIALVWKSTAPLASTASMTQPFATPPEHAITIFDLEPDADPPRVLAIGPDPAGNLLEIIWLELEDINLVIHAMPLRAQFYDLLPQSPEDMP